MRAKTRTGICVALIAMAIGASSVWAAKKKVAVETPLTESGQKLQERYTGMLTELQAEISKAVPAVDEQKKAECETGGLGQKQGARGAAKP